MIGRTAKSTLMVLAVVASLISACGTGSAGVGSADTGSTCDEAFAQAMAIDPGSDTVQQVDGTFAGCSSLESWVAAAQRFPDAFGGQDPGTIAAERCAASPALASTPVCMELSASSS
ncbi:MAG TPA: hypothetical protein VFP66_06215 [Candidatus Limnocylindrales bacterium]|nr:hypothetical protein [Candidatus Limnocylindrales bacterium]